MPPIKGIETVQRFTASSVTSGRVPLCGWFVSAVVVTVLCWASPHAAPADEQFLRRHCVACHDRDGHEAGLNLEDLQVTPVQHENLLTLERVFDRISRGEMPPPDEQQPSAAEKKTFLDRLGAAMRQTGVEQQAAEGRCGG